MKVLKTYSYHFDKNCDPTRLKSKILIVNL